MFACCIAAYDGYLNLWGQRVLENILSYWYLVQVFTVIVLIKRFISRYILIRGTIKQGYQFDIHLAVVYRCTRHKY